MVPADGLRFALCQTFGADHRRQFSMSSLGKGSVFLVMILAAHVVLGCQLLPSSTSHMCNPEPGAYDYWELALTEWFEEADRATLVCVEVEAPHHVYLQKREQRVEVGMLTQQLGQFPAETIILQFDEDLLLLGRVEDNVRGVLDYVDFWRGGDPKASAYLNKSSNPLGRFFFVPIYEYEMPAWETLKMAQVYNLFQEEPAVKVRFSPAISLTELAIPAWFK